MVAVVTGTICNKNELSKELVVTWLIFERLSFIYQEIPHFLGNDKTRGPIMGWPNPWAFALAVPCVPALSWGLQEYSLSSSGSSHKCPFSGRLSQSLYCKLKPPPQQHFLLPLSASFISQDISNSNRIYFLIYLFPLFHVYNDRAEVRARTFVQSTANPQP